MKNTDIGKNTGFEKTEKKRIGNKGNTNNFQLYLQKKFLL